MHKLLTDSGQPTRPWPKQTSCGWLACWEGVWIAFPSLPALCHCPSFQVACPVTMRQVVIQLHIHADRRGRGLMCDGSVHKHTHLREFASLWSCARALWLKPSPVGNAFQLLWGVNHKQNTFELISVISPPQGGLQQWDIETNAVLHWKACTLCESSDNFNAVALEKMDKTYRTCLDILCISSCDFLPLLSWLQILLAFMAVLKWHFRKKKSVLRQRFVNAWDWSGVSLMKWLWPLQQNVCVSSVVHLQCLHASSVFVCASVSVWLAGSDSVWCAHKSHWQPVTALALATQPQLM